MGDDFNFLFKVVIIGDSGVGKSNLMTRYTCGEFSQETPSTIGVEFMTKPVKLDDREVKVQIWDTAGQERFRAISRSIYHGAKGAMLVYDITNQQSFDNCASWLQELKLYVHPTTVIILVGNKCDLEHLRVVKKDAANRFAQENGLTFFETSALEKTNVEKSFTYLVKCVYDQAGPSATPNAAGGAGGPKPQPKQSAGIDLSKPANDGAGKDKKKCAC